MSRNSSKLPVAGYQQPTYQSSSARISSSFSVGNLGYELVGVCEAFGGVYAKMRPHELQELLESRREYVPSEAASERITEIQGDLDYLENDCEKDIKEILNRTDYKVESVVFNIDVDTGHRNESFPSGARYTKVKKRLVRSILRD